MQMMTAGVAGRAWSGHLSEASCNPRPKCFLPTILQCAARRWCIL